jgi:hypothetical protein
MDLNFDKLPRFKIDAMKVWSLVPQWAHAHQVSEEAIIYQLYTAHAWCDSNPKRAPKKQVARFLWSWMGQAKRYGNLKVKPVESLKPKEYEENRDMTYEEMVAIRQQNMRKST